MPPINLGRFARQGLQPVIGFGPRTGAVVGDQMPEVVRTAGMATFPHHCPEARHPQKWQRIASPCAEDAGLMRSAASFDSRGSESSRGEAGEP